MKMELPVSVDFTGAPLYYIENPLNIICTPNKMEFAVDSGKVDSIESVSLGKIDFSSLAPGVNTFDFDTSTIASAIPMDKDQKFKVYINTNDVEEKEFIITNKQISVVGNESKYNVDVAPSTSLKIKVIGTKGELEKITADNITAVVDLKGKEFSRGGHNYTARVTVKNNDFCWAYGKYDVPVLVTK